jgi:2-methylcitrate dehydratase
MAAGQKTRGGAETIRALARAVASAETPAVSSAAMNQAQLLLLDTIGCGIAGAREHVARSVADLALDDGGKAQCALIGRAARTSLLSAVLANGVAVRVLDLNDYLIGDSKGRPESGGHPSDNIPVALAAGAARSRSGAEILSSIIIGYELYARLQRNMDRGGAWDGVTVSGIVAAAIAGRLLGLDEHRLAHTLALGAMRAATPGIVRSGEISAAKSLANALVAQSGVQAAMLAERGLTGPLAIIDHSRGLREVFAHSDPALIAAPFVSCGAILRAHVKAYPCINTGQSAVAAALQLHRALSGDAASLVRIEVVMADYPVVARHQDDPDRIHPVSREAADHSFPFLVAVALIDGAFGIAQFEGERWRDPQVNALMSKITMSRDANWNVRAPGAYPCAIRARDSAGREFMIEMAYPPGFSRTGLDKTVIIDKFHAIAAPSIAQGARQRIVDAVMAFPHSRTTGELDAAIAIEGTFP